MELVSVHDTKPVIEYLTQTLTKHLTQGEHVLWLVPGGSAMRVAAAVSQQLPSDRFSQLTISLTDERYGELDHADENWNQLAALGFVAEGARQFRVLNGSNREETTARYADFLYKALAEADFSIGLFGMGADGHAAGIKPGSIAVESEAFAASFKGEDFERITMTPTAIRELNEIVVYAFGAEKFPQISRLLHEDLTLVEQPAQTLKYAEKSTLFSDYQEEN